MQLALIITASVIFVIPFVVWMFIRFRVKVNQNFSTWHKPVIIWSFVSCFAIFIILLMLAIFLF